MYDPIVLTPEQAPAALKIVGEELTILASGEQTGSYEIFRQAGPEGSGPPPHNHPWDEAFYVTAGTLHFGLEGEEAVATAGTLVHVPGGTTHWFRFGDGGGEMLSMTSRAGASAFFTQAAAEVSPSDPDFGALVAIATQHGLTFPPPPA
jgi:quercetin dioxygenase-like cupin family protein